MYKQLLVEGLLCVGRSPGGRVHKHLCPHMELKGDTTGREAEDRRAKASGGAED